MNFHEQVNHFLGDARVHAIRDLARESRSLKICYPREVPISRFLAWVLDPTQGHGLADSVLRALFLAAWSVRSEHLIATPIRHFLSPTFVEAQSFDDCLVEREVQLPDGKLDVLVLDPKNRWLLAVEHKFGARESGKQLSNYRKSLAKLFPKWKRILVFLDFEAQSPSDESWIGLDYEWLVRELKRAEESPWIAASCKSVLRDFCDAVDWEAREFVHISDDQLLEVVNEHRAVFETMQQWSRTAQSFTSVSAKLFSASGSSEARAKQQLFKVFWQRRFLWESCFPILSFGGLLAAARKAYPMVEHWADRKCVYFRLPEWAEFDAADEEHEEWAVAVRVRPLANEQKFGANTFGVLSYIDPTRWRPELFSARAIARVEAFRSETMRKRALSPEDDNYPLKVKRPVAEDKISGVLVQHLRQLETLMKETRLLHE
jgi:hypothetical protein